MSTTDHESQAVTNANARKLKQFRTIALSLPEPGDDWAVSDTSLNGGDIQRMKEVGAVECVGWERVDVDKDYPNGGGNYNRNRWRTDPDVYAWIHEHLTNVAECPADGCRATGVSNPRNVDGYKCTNADCDRTLTRTEAKRLTQ
jgi:hypothetical protein